jgi:hypothetical protein
VDLDIIPLWERALKLGPGLRQPQISELTDISVSSLNRAVNHLQNLDLGDYRIVERTLQACEEIQRQAGVPINWKDVRVAKQLIADYEEELKNPPEAPSEDDWKFLNATSPEKMKTLAEELGVTIPELLVRTEEALKRFDFVVHTMRTEMQSLDRNNTEKKYDWQCVCCDI